MWKNIVHDKSTFNNIALLTFDVWMKIQINFYIEPNVTPGKFYFFKKVSFKK